MSAQTILPSLAISLTLTLALEEAFALAWGVRGKDLALCALVNILTNPIVVLLHALAQMHGIAPLWAVTLALEVWAVAVEAWLYRTRSGVRRPVLFAVLVNAFSYGIGFLL